MKLLNKCIFLTVVSASRGSAFDDLFITLPFLDSVRMPPIISK